MDSVRGPHDTDKSDAAPFLLELISRARTNMVSTYHPGDLLSLQLTVMYGEVLFAEYDPLKGVPAAGISLRVAPIRSPDLTRTVPRVRVRVLLREPKDQSVFKLPFGHVLVKGVATKLGTDVDWLSWSPVWATRLKASEARTGKSIQGGEVAEFFIYDEISENLLGGIGLPATAAFYPFRLGNVELLRSPSIWALWDRYQSRMDDVEGVVFKDDEIDIDLINSLNANISSFASTQTELDHWPHLKGVVVDVVHPSAFSHDGSESESEIAIGAQILTTERRCLHESGSRSSEVAKDPPQKRTYPRDGNFIDSEFAWLPAVVDVSEKGECRFASYIHNLPMSESGLYSNLGSLFGHFLPMFEEVYRNIMAAEFLRLNKRYRRQMKEEREASPFLDRKLRNRELKVLVEITDYEFRKNDSYEDVWHLEGMSPESILMTGLFILNRDEYVEGGQVMFKRGFLDCESELVFHRTPPCPHRAIQKIFEGRMLPLGTLDTPCGRMIVFPNNLPHKFKKMRRCDIRSEERIREVGKARQRVVVFSVVDPDRRDILTSRDVPK